MKKFIAKAFAFLVIALTCINANAQDNPFDKFADSKDVTYVYISEAMLKLFGTDVMPSINGVDISEIGSKLKSIQVITSEKATKKSLKSEAMDIIKKHSYERLMQIAEKDNNVDIYHKGGKDNSIIVMVNENNDDTVLIVFSGTFNVSNILQMFKSAKQE